MVEVLTQHEVDLLTADFNLAVSSVAFNPDKKARMTPLLKDINPHFEPTQIKSPFVEAEVLADVVAAIYAPLIHGFTETVVENIKAGRIPGTVMAPIRDALPIVVSLQEMAKLKGVAVKILTPPINRITAGVANNQNDYPPVKDPLFGQLIDQIMTSLDGQNGITELETGIYGTTSLVTAQLMKEKGLAYFVPIKFYGLGPNLSYVHAVLSGGQEWLAEAAEAGGLVEPQQIGKLMVLLDSLEEMGMQNFCQSVSHLTIGTTGLVEPAIVGVNPKMAAIACASNRAMGITAAQYVGIEPQTIAELLEKTPQVVEFSNQGWPFTLKQPIPPMDSKEEHFQAVKASHLFDYPKLILKTKGGD